MMNITYYEVAVFYKYCVNRVDMDKFVEMMIIIYPGHKSYVEGLWDMFRNDPMNFIVTRGERHLFSIILEEIEKKDYKG